MFRNACSLRSPFLSIYKLLNVGIKEPISTHSMRKTWGYWAYKSGTSLALIMEALNHSSITNTRKYLGITQDDLDNVYMSLNL